MRLAGSLFVLSRLVDREPVLAEAVLEALTSGTRLERATVDRMEAVMLQMPQISHLVYQYEANRFFPDSDREFLRGALQPYFELSSKAPPGFLQRFDQFIIDGKLA